MKTFRVNMYGKEEELYCKRYEYTAFGNTMVQLYTIEGEPYCSLSTNPSFAVPQCMFYSCPNNYGTILEKMVELKLIKLSDSIWRSGFNTYQSFIINEKVFTQYEKESI